MRKKWIYIGVGFKVYRPAMLLVHFLLSGLRRCEQVAARSRCHMHEWHCHASPMMNYTFKPWAQTCPSSLKLLFPGIVSQVRKYFLHGLAHWEWTGSSIQGATTEDVCNLHSLSPPTLLHTSVWAPFPVSSQGVMHPPHWSCQEFLRKLRIFLCLPMPP